MSTTNVSVPFVVTPELKAFRTLFKMIDPVAPNIASRIALRLFLTPARRQSSPKAKALFSTATVTSTTHGSREIVTYVWENSGPKILLVHGWGSDATGFYRLIPPLLEEGFEVIAFDAPAHGRSEGKQTNVLDFSGAILDVINQHGPFETVIGHSFGAATSLYALSANPNLTIQKAVTLGAPTQFSELLNVWASVLLLPPKIFEGFLQKIVDRVGVPIQSLDIDQKVAHLSIPGLIVHDQDDNIVSVDNGKKLAQQWSNSEFLETRKLGHRGILRDDEVIQKIVSFVCKSQKLS
ncbi:MAG: alpha/beta hydrolase [Chloroflexota bacterium]